MSTSGVAVRIGRDVAAKTKYDVVRQTLVITKPAEPAHISFGARVALEPDAQNEAFMNLSVKTRYGLERLRDAITAYLAAGGEPQAELDAAAEMYPDTANRGISIAPGTRPTGTPAVARPVAPVPAPKPAAASVWD